MMSAWQIQWEWVNQTPYFAGRIPCLVWLSVQNLDWTLEQWVGLLMLRPGKIHVIHYQQLNCQEH